MLSSCGYAASPPKDLSAIQGSQILPGSKGDRNLHRTLQVQILLPVAEASMALKQLSTDDLAGLDVSGWNAHFDAKAAVETRLLKVERLADELRLSFQLEQIEPLATVAFHELVFYAGDGIVQTAALLPALDAAPPEGPSILSESLSSTTLSQWLIARQFQEERGQSLQALSKAEFQELSNLPDVADLAQHLAAMYRQNKGKSDPLKSDIIRAKAGSGSKHLKDKLNYPAKDSTSGDKPSDSQSSEGKPSTLPGSKPAELPSADGKPASDNQAAETSPQPQKSPKADKAN